MFIHFNKLADYFQYTINVHETRIRDVKKWIPEDRENIAIGSNLAITHMFVCVHARVCVCVCNNIFLFLRKRKVGTGSY